MEPKNGGGILSAGREEATSGAMEADPFDQPYWNLDQYLIWLARRDPAAVLRATDCPNSGANPPIGWRMHRESNGDRQKVEMAAVQAITGGHIKARIEFNGEWFTRDDPEWFADWVIDFEGEPTFAALLMPTTKDGGEKRSGRDSIRRVLRSSTELPLLATSATGPMSADRDAELKPVTPQAWQVLSIDPLYGQPEADLRAVGYRREYGRATKGDGGPVIWEGLCFDRKQFVAAFMTGAGNGPSTHTPAAQPTQPRERTPRKQPLRERARRALNELYPSGVPDPISKTNAELVRAVGAHLVTKREKCLSRDTILRAAGRRKQRK